jgi:hypothetical protein
VQKQEVLAFEMAADHPGIGPEFRNDVVIGAGHDVRIPTANCVARLDAHRTSNVVQAAQRLIDIASTDAREERLVGLVQALGPGVEPAGIEAG